MQNEIQFSWYDDQEPNNAAALGAAANLEGFEEFGQDHSGEEPADVAASKRLAPWLVGAAAEETSSPFAPPEPDLEVDSQLIDWADPFAPEGLAAESEDPAVSADLSDPALYDTGVADPWGTLLPGTVEQEGESIFTPPWEDPNAQPPRTLEQDQEPILNPFFTAPWEDDPSAPDPSIFSVGWDNVVGTPPEGQEDDPYAVYEEVPKPLDVWSDTNSMAEETMVAGDIWQGTAEGLAEDVGGAFEDVGEAIGNVVDDIPW